MQANRVFLTTPSSKKSSRLRQLTPEIGNIDILGTKLTISSSLLLSQSLGYTVLEFAMIENAGFAARISMLCHSSREMSISGTVGHFPSVITGIASP